MEHETFSPVARTRYGKVRLRGLSDLDKRTAAAGRFVELADAYAADLGGDLTTAQTAIIQRICAIQLWCENEEVRYVETAQLDISAFTTATNALRRLLADIGLERRSRDITPSLDQYLAENYADKASE